MNKQQEEIWEGMMAFLCAQDNRKVGECFENSSHPNCLYYVNERGCDKVYGLLWFLKSRGVVIKTEGELPERMFIESYGYLQGHSIKSLLDTAGYEAVESLIGEDNARL